MYVLELAAQNVRGFSPTGRTPLKPGYNVLKPPAAALPTIGQLAVALCFSDGRGGDASFKADGAPSGKAGLTLVGNDQVTYRLLRELGGAGALHKQNPATQKFELVSEDAAEITQFLRGQVGLPSKGAFDQLFCLSGAQLPSRRPKKKPAAQKADAPRTISREGMPAVMAAEDVGAAERRLAELTAELKTAKETAQVQFEFDGVVSEIYEIERKVKDLDELKARAAEAEATWKAAPTAASLKLPADLVKRCEYYRDYVAKRDAELAKLKDQREEDLEPFVFEGMQPKASRVPAVWEDPRFWYGVGAGVAALALGIFLSGSLKYLALLDIPAFGFSGVLALKWVEELQAKNTQTRRGGRKAAREAKIREEYEAQAAAVEKAMQLLDVDQPEQVIEKLREKDTALAAYNKVRAKAEAMEADPKFRAMLERLPQAKADHERLNGELVGRGGYMREPREVEKDIDRVKQSIALAKGPVQAAAPVPNAPPEPSPGVEDPSPAILKVVADLLQSDVPTAAATVRDRALQYFAALTDKRYQMLEFDLEGNGFAHAAGKKLSISELPPKDADLFALSLRLTGVEKAAARVKVPLFVEDAVSCVDDAKLPLLARMLKHLGTMTQVIHATTNPGFANVAENVANI